MKVGDFRAMTVDQLEAFRATVAEHLDVVDHWVFASQSAADYMLRVYDIAPERIELIPHGAIIDLDRPRPPLDPALLFDEPLRLGPFALCHYPRPVAGAYVLAGHWHPCVSVRGRAFERLRLPCFWLGDDSGQEPSRAVGVLPAFGSFTGMHPVRGLPGDRVFAIADDRVVPILGMQTERAGANQSASRA